METVSSSFVQSEEKKKADVEIVEVVEDQSSATINQAPAPAPEPVQKSKRSARPKTANSSQSLKNRSFKSKR